MKEILLRLKGEMNTFWIRFRNWFLALGIFAGTVTDLLRLFLDDPLVPDEWRPWLRIVYSIMLWAALQAQMTVRNSERLKYNKEFDQKMQHNG